MSLTTVAVFGKAATYLDFDDVTVPHAFQTQTLKPQAGCTTDNPCQSRTATLLSLLSARRCSSGCHRAMPMMTTEKASWSSLSSRGKPQKLTIHASVELDLRITYRKSLDNAYFKHITGLRTRERTPDLLVSIPGRRTRRSQPVLWEQLGPQCHRG